MKLFIWNEPYPVKYGSSMVFAVAETVEEAREIAKASPRYSFDSFDGTGGTVGLGTPDRVVDLPCAEWHEWSE